MKSCEPTASKWENANQTVCGVHIQIDESIDCNNDICRYGRVYISWWSPFKVSEWYSFVDAMVVVVGECGANTKCVCHSCNRSKYKWLFNINMLLGKKNEERERKFPQFRDMKCASWVNFACNKRIRSVYTKYKLCEFVRAIVCLSLLRKPISFCVCFRVDRPFHCLLSQQLFRLFTSFFRLLSHCLQAVY